MLPTLFLEQLLKLLDLGSNRCLAISRLRMKAKVVLMILLGRVKIGKRTYVGHDFFPPEDFFDTDFCDNFFCCLPLCVVVVEDNRPILSPDVLPLAVQ